MELLARATSGESLLLIAPTGAGKTLAGFLPALTDLTISVIDHLVPRPAAGSAAGAGAPVSPSSVS